jgi:hypothetical protein
MPEQALADAMAAPTRQWARATAWAAIGTLGDGDPARQLEALGQFPESRLRDDLSTRAIGALAATDAAAAEAHLQLLSEPRRRDRVLSEILGKFAERDPSAALVRVRELAPEATRAGGIRLVTAVLRAAAKEDASSALAAIDELPPALQEQARGAALVGWAQEHAAEALSWAAANGVNVLEAKAFVYFGDDGGVGWNSLLSTAFERDRAKTLEWLRAQPPSADRDRMLMEGIWSGNTEEKLQIYGELTAWGQTQAAARMVEGSYRSDGDRGQSEAWVRDQPAGPAKQAAIRGFCARETGNGPERVEEIAAAWPLGAERDAALRGITDSFSYNNPARAIEFARRISAAPVREAATERVAQVWLSRDKDAARAWIGATSDLSAEQKRVLLRQADGD